MKNPWKELINKANNNFVVNDNKYIIKEDLKVIEKFNKSFKSKKSKDNYEIHYEIHPSHYTGNINEAKILLLASNPGYVESEIETLYKLPSFHKEMIENLDFKTKTFINLDKKRIEQGDYWKKKTEKLKNEVGIGDKIYEKIALIQFLPYHSKKFRKIAKKYFENESSYLTTQKYGFELVKSAIKKGKIIIILRSKKEWYKAIPELVKYKNEDNVFEIKNYRNPYITPNNFTKQAYFNRIVEILKK